MAARTWFSTGTSRGFGREWAIAALDRGDNVAATARNVESLKDLADKYGDKILPIEPGGFSTDWGGSSTKRAEPLPAYKAAHEESDRQRSSRTSSQGDPAATRSAILKVVDADKPPLRVFFGEAPLSLEAGGQ